MTVISLAEARRKRDLRLSDLNGKSASLTFRIDSSGCLEVNVIGPNGRVVEQYEADRENTDRLLDILRREQRDALLAEQKAVAEKRQRACKHPANMVEPATRTRPSVCRSCWLELAPEIAPKWTTCGAKPDGRQYAPRRDLCRRRSGHAGAHRNKKREWEST